MAPISTWRYYHHSLASNLVRFSFLLPQSQQKHKKPNPKRDF
ncbi:hypothetical protein VCHA38O206_20163 [Vibrio chagasii]|nr:hypothetical protein VCHA35P150_30163 [Vibrio chagasii]CAH7243614.1 hypothetical protein VCHA38O206_20163 [Vibrio chagasii]